MTHDGLLIDFGGVLTTNVFDSFAAFCRAEGLEEHTVRDLFRNDPAARDLLGGLEEGRISEPEFERRFAPMIGIDDHDRLIERLFGGIGPDDAMIDAVAAAHRVGVRTGLVSNSWGDGTYDRSRFGELFDTVVISGEVGVRKPQPEIYALACERLGLPPERCVFIDDLGGNLKPAAAIGMATVLHRDAQTTIPRLEALLGVSLR